ncbi:MAG: hypothetical protein HKP12_13305 [Gammaproteobacteria bacterium]|nr:hypothetical protein [Gammaproteobacteria bacterium]NNJ98125.1 hypothetical protein [Gammaproteobacteria bacterium]
MKYLDIWGRLAKKSSGKKAQASTYLCLISGKDYESANNANNASEPLIFVSF